MFGQSGNKESDSINYLTGIVRDAKTKKVIPSAQIQSLNHVTAATADSNGTFKIKIFSQSEMLIVKAFDYNPREISVRGRQNIVIDLYPEDFKDFYPVTEELTGPVRSSFSVSARNSISQIVEPYIVSADEAIESNLGGNIRAISKSGLSGIGSSFFIRGLNSINLNSQPLIVVDGVEWNNSLELNSLHNGFFNNSLADIDPNDIECITIIKDGVSLYGSKGGNGVILIKTKRGKDMATKIDVNTVVGIIDSPNSLPLMDGDEFRLYVTDLLGTNNLSKNEIETMKFLNDDTSDVSYLKYHNSTNWNKEVYRQGILQTYNISVNGGDNRALYYFSIGYTGNKEVVKNVDMQRLNTRFNADFFFSNRINMGLNIAFTNIDRNLLDDGVDFYTSPTFLAMIKAPFLNPYSYTADGTLTADLEDCDDFNVGNPTAIIKNSLNTNKHYRLNIGLKPVFQLSKSLSVSNHFEYSLSKIKETYYRPIIGAADQYIAGYGISTNVFKNQLIRDNNLFNDLRLQYIHQFGNKHLVNALAGIRYSVDIFESDYGEGHNTGSDQKRNLLNEEVFKTINGENINIKDISNYINLSYSFDNRYFISTAVSLDASSRFGNATNEGIQLFNHSWGIFPSFDAAWLISSEKFMNTLEFIDMLKLRAGFGYTGNDNIEPYASKAYLGSVKYMDRANGLILKNIGNTEIQWETLKKLNIGLDLNLFNDRLSCSADIFNNYTSNLLKIKKVPYLVGDGYYWENGGELSNKGFEFSFNAKLLNQSKIKWEIGSAIGHYKNKIESLPENYYTTSIYGAEILTSPGNPIGVFYGFKTKGIFKTEEEAKQSALKIIDENGIEHYFQAGDVHFDDLTGDSIINDADKQIIGDPNPDFYGSFNSKVIIGNFTINLLFNFSYGNDIYNYLRSEMEAGDSFFNQTTAMLNRWSYEGQETNQPKAVYGDPMGNNRFSDRWIEDGSFLKLKSFSVNYRVPLKNKIIQGLNVWIAANNLFTLTKYLGRDPEVSVNNGVLYQGIDAGLLPLNKGFYLGLKLNL